jgi:proteasome assembly chaperone (PAC2) family protein
MQDVKREMAKVYRESRSELIDPAAATKLVWVLQAVGKIIEISDLEKRLEALENRK